MKAIVQTAYGAPNVLKSAEITKPAPKAGEVLVRIHATTATAADSMMREGTPRIGRLYLGLFRPKRPVLGFEFSGVVEEVGEGVTKFQVGEAVFGGTTTLGSYAEYAIFEEDDVIVSKPTTISHEQAAPVCGSAVTAWNFLKKQIDLQPGQRILINGASGGVGTYAVQLARHFGAEVTAVCSQRNHEMVRSIGANEVIDYTKEDFTKSGQKWDVILDAVGASSFGTCRGVLSEQGVYLSPVLSLPLFWSMLWTSRSTGQKAIFSATGMLSVEDKRTYLEELRTLMEKGEIQTVIDRHYSLEEMADAHRYVDTGRKRGNLVIHCHA